MNRGCQKIVIGTPERGRALTLPVGQNIAQVCSYFILISLSFVPPTCPCICACWTVNSSSFPQSNPMVSQLAESSQPSRSAVSNRAPTKLLAGIPARRTTEKVQLEKEAAAIAAEKVKASTRAEKLAIQQKFGTIEDQVRREDIHRQKIAAQPDLHDPVSDMLYMLSFYSQHQTVKPKWKRVPGAGKEDEPPKLKFILKPVSPQSSQQFDAC